MKLAEACEDDVELSDVAELDELDAVDADDFDEVGELSLEELVVSVLLACSKTSPEGAPRPGFSAPGKWGRTQMGSDGSNGILTRLYFFSLVGVRLVPLKTHDFKGF